MEKKLKIISLEINKVSFEESLQQVIRLGQSHESSWVCFANVHMTIEAYKDPAFAAQLKEATLVLADGKPIASACRWIHGQKQERIAGMDFMPRILERANQASASIFLYGSTPEMLAALIKKTYKEYPGINIAGFISPPFRNLSPEELMGYIQTINASGANIVLVSLGCPKQEKWMAENSKNIKAVLLGIGGAFAVHSGLQKRSPRWMQRSGLEWLYRLFQEPGRLFKRYLTTNPLFIWLLIKAVFKGGNHD